MFQHPIGEGIDQGFAGGIGAVEDAMATVGCL
jgi:hypothetical protein